MTARTAIARSPSMSFRYCRAAWRSLTGMLCQQLRRRFADHLLHVRVPFEHLEPRVHAQGKHAFIDRRVAQLGGAEVLDDGPTKSRRHGHDFVDARAALRARSAAGI